MNSPLFPLFIFLWVVVRPTFAFIHLGRVLTCHILSVGTSLILAENQEAAAAASVGGCFFLPRSQMKKISYCCQVAIYNIQKTQDLSLSLLYTLLYPSFQSIRVTRAKVVCVCTLRPCANLNIDPAVCVLCAMQEGKLQSSLLEVVRYPTSFLPSRTYH